ncbi:hypothetical protein RclHR1_00550028 [Rhizophagus clarus]|nr:hypothetical protein RclHR1_00550028 [Rhizophagus clarus]
MDGTFKTILTVFCQLYTLHALVCGENLRILPLVYLLLTGKSEEIYRCLFEELVDFTAESNITLQPSVIITDFELASINASCQVFPDIDAFSICASLAGKRFSHVDLQLDMNDTISYLPPLFPPQLWSTYDLNERQILRTQNNVEAWHQHWEILVGQSHAGVYTIIEELQKERQNVDLQVECIARGEP